MTTCTARCACGRVEITVTGEPPSSEFFTKHRHGWVSPIAGAVQLRDPLGADAELAMRTADGRSRLSDRSGSAPP